MSNPDPTLIGASCLVWWEGVLVLEVQKAAKWRLDEAGEVHIGLGCIGGSLDTGETAIEALQREALEEMGCRIALQDAPLTYAVTPDCRVIEQTCRDVACNISHRACSVSPAVRPLLIWEACLPGLTPGRRVAVFRGRATAEPAPVDLPALLFVTPAILLAIGAAPMRLEEALKLGAVLRARAVLPDTAWLELTGTPAVLHLLHIRREPLAGMLLQAV